MPNEHIQIKPPVNDEYPFELLLLSGEPIRTQKLGWFIVDLETLSWHKDRLIVDYVHEEDKILGYADQFRLTDDGLYVAGKLVSDAQYITRGKSENIDDDDGPVERIPGPLVDRIVKLASHGTPFEASPTINVQDGNALFLAKGQSAVVNGKERHGPLTIFKNVPLRAMAICPIGTDRWTHFTALKERFKTMNVKKNTKKAPLEKRHLETVLPPEPDVTKLADEGAPEGPKIKDPDLAEFCELYGTEKGLQLWQDGADINDIRTMKELIDKYGVPGPPEEPTQLSEEDPPATPPESDPTPAPSEDENTKLKAHFESVLTKGLADIQKKFDAELTKLKALFPRGETEPVSSGIPPTEQAPTKEKTLPSSVHRMAAKIGKKLSE
jgi:hypothetical protein